MEVRVNYTDSSSTLHVFHELEKSWEMYLVKNAGYCLGRLWHSLSLRTRRLIVLENENYCL